MKTKIGCFVVLIMVMMPAVKVHAQAGADSLLSFIQKNKDRSSLFLTANDTVVAHLNEGKIMPLASTVKIIVALEFARQAAHNAIDQNERIPLAELNKYYVANTDGNAHPGWIAYETKQGHILHDSVALINVARGMTIFSSNANMEYLLDRLGFDNVNNNLRLLGLKNHTPIYPLVSALFFYQNPKKINEEKILQEIRKMSNAQYAQAALLIHRELKGDSNYKKQFRPQDLTLKMQREWSDRLPASTTAEYVKLCYILNKRKDFDDATYQVLAKELEAVMENPANQSWLLHSGMKGGSTAYVGSAV